MPAILSTLVLLSVLGTTAMVSNARAADRAAPKREVRVSGTGVHHFSTAITHSRESVGEGVVIQRSTDTVTLEGDLRGTVLYHSTAEFDEQAGSAVVTGVQVFSGTVLEGLPTVLFDDRFRFDIDLRTGETRGEVHFEPSRDAQGEPDVWCDLVVTGTGTTADGDSTFAYEGTCRTR